jgi:hypothetical protein
MKLTRLLSLLALAALVVSVPLAAFAQEEPEMKDFVSEDGLLTVSYPADWFIEENAADVSFPGVMIGNSEETLAGIVSGSDEEIQPGEAGMIMILIPADFFAFLGVDVSEETTPDDLATIVVENIFGTESSTDESEATAEPTAAATEEAIPEFGEATVVDLTEDLQAGYVAVTEAATEGAVIVFQADGIVVITIAVAYTGEYTEEVDALALAVAASVEYTGTADDLMNALMGI